MTDAPNTETLKYTRLYQRHVDLGARMVPFAGYAMPVQYDGVLGEHKWTRAECGLFDVSHMGQARLKGKDAIATLEALTPTDFKVLKAGRQKYSLLLNDNSGILDDLMVSRPETDGLFLVVNAGCKDQDFAYIGRNLKGDTSLEILSDRALLALQGPKAKEVMAKVIPAACEMYFMDCGTFTWQGHTVYVSRSGYTGEDGFEISVHENQVAELWDALLSDPVVKPIGLGARDSLRLEAGMPLYGHEMDTGYSLAEANLGFAMSKSRLEAGDILGFDRLKPELDGGLTRVRVALKGEAGPPAREGAKILTEAGEEIGYITSGGPSPSAGGLIALGYVPPAFSEVGTNLTWDVRGKAYPCTVVALPFVKNGYHRKKSA
ncbi:glycine cleavage system aminomethyltransferase GcvT [Asticcacaulis endophyticus]|uniref:aminomethyltransferase n=1 Tax=Asticcacaulis endophyticus TaxID=1395890 RepID=A0A918QAG8_9CAUL|nr:glycine cleavage system aminomethyltransferase GcvT [Asticcacaulis endophyticus]GGZ37024.1 aminomethyltransferase [Asticcacaulis endophyticus]